MAGSLLKALGLKPSRRALDATTGHPVLGETATEQVRADSDVDSPTFKLDAEAKSSAPASPRQLPKGAKVKPFGTSRVEYDFGQPITRELAAKAIFSDGKVPHGFKLEAGPGANGWTLRADDPADLQAWQAMVNKMRARTQEVDTKDSSQVEEDWSGTKKVEAKKPGFWVNRRYDLDVGQIPEWMIRRRLHESGAVGYEVIFDTALDEKEVMVKLFASNAPWDQIQLLPMGGSPTTFWVIRLIGIEAYAFNRTASSVFGWNPKSPLKNSAMPGVPDTMRQHLEGKTVPKGARKHRSNVYVWEEDGHLAYVETDAPNGGGNVYKFETTKVSGTGGKGDQEYLRDLVLNQGMKPKDAWMKYEKEFLELVKGMGGSVDLNIPKLQVPRGVGHAPGGVGRAPSGGGRAPSGGGHAPSGVGHAPTRCRARTRQRCARARRRWACTQWWRARSQRRRARGQYQAAKASFEATRPRKYGGRSKWSASEAAGGRKRFLSWHSYSWQVSGELEVASLSRHPGNQDQDARGREGTDRWRVPRTGGNGQTMEGVGMEKLNLPRGNHGPLELTKRAQERFGLDNDWFSVGNKYIYGRDPRVKDL